ncbi:hypothetical protein EGW08_018939, partial [Elysia chlorotica]
MKVVVWIITFILLSESVHIRALSRTSDESEARLARIQPEEGFLPGSKDIFLLSQSNFTNCVLRSRDPWVVIPTSGDALGVWKRLVKSLKGVAFFGTINPTQDAQLLSELNFPTQSSVESGAVVARVYPYGKANVKARQYQDISDPDDIQSFIVQSLPGDTVTSVGSDEELNEFLMNCLLNAPTKFPVVFIVDESRAVPGQFLSLSSRLGRYFSFCRVGVASAWALLRDLDTEQVLVQEE